MNINDVPASETRLTEDYALAVFRVTVIILCLITIILILVIPWQTSIVLGTPTPEFREMERTTGTSVISNISMPLTGTGLVKVETPTMVNITESKALKTFDDEPPKTFLALIQKQGKRLHLLSTMCRIIHGLKNTCRFWRLIKYQLLFFIR